MKKLRNHAQLKEQANSPETAKNKKKLLQSDRHWVQKGGSENTERIKAEYQGIKSVYEQLCRFL